MPQDFNNPQAQEFFAYSVNFSALAAGSSATGYINIEANSYFKVQKLTFAADIAAAAQTESSRVIPNATILITNSGSGRQLMNTAVPIPSLFGTGRLPFILPTPKVFDPSTTITVQVANYDAAVTYNLYIVMIGSKLWF